MADHKEKLACRTSDAQDAFVGSYGAHISNDGNIVTSRSSTKKRIQKFLCPRRDNANHRAQSVLVDARNHGPHAKGPS